MEIDFSKPEEASEKLDRALESGETPELVFSQEDILEELTNAVRILLDRANWVKHVGMENKHPEKQRFMDAWKNETEYAPEFRFQEPGHDPDALLKIIEDVKEACEGIVTDTLERYGAEEVTAKDLRSLFRETFDELALYVKIARDIDDREKWKQHCLDAWPMDEDLIAESVKRLEQGFETEEEEKELRAEDLKQMWKEELERIDVEWKVEVRETRGCFNIPEERTVVVAKGDEEERNYSEEEARLLTMHELFHVVRAYNGIKVGEESGLPPFLGLHTPFYDMTEEGGAIYREFATGVITPSQEKDYHLRAVAAHCVYRGMEFSESVERMVELGATPERAFDLLARNREVLRHHIYIGGYLRDWKDRDETWPLLLGKVNTSYAEILKKEVEGDGMIKKPPVTGEDLFDYRF